MATATGWHEVAQWILDQRDDAAEPGRLDSDLDLFEAGVLTSLQVIELLVVIERAGGQKIDRMEIHPDNFRTLRSIQRKFFPNYAYEVPKTSTAG